MNILLLNIYKILLLSKNNIQHNNGISDDHNISISLKLNCNVLIFNLNW